MNKSKVYFTKDISPKGLIKIYKALGVELKGKVGVKISTGEAGGNNYLKPELIKDLVKLLNGDIIECNTAYPGKRNTVEDHMQVAKDHGFTDIANVVIMDAEGEKKIPVNDGKHLKYDIVGVALDDYDSMLNLAHCKGQVMGGFGGVLKNQSIGIASANGKAYIHSAGATDSPEKCWKMLPEQNDFLESMAEAAKAVSDYFAKQNKKILYIDVMNNLSVDCDCDSNPEEPCMQDIGILSSLDPVALDQACIDLIWSSTDSGKEYFKKRVEKQNGRHILPYAEQIGLGTTNYELINIDGK